MVVPAGNDGVYGLDAATGAVRWHFRADLHIDSTPGVGGGKVVVGSGPSRKTSRQEVVCLDAVSGAVAWRTPTRLPAWGPPLVAGDRVYIGLGNGRLDSPVQPPATRAGGLLCLDMATGSEVWFAPAGDAVFTRPAVVSGVVVFGSRDGHLYGVTPDGHEWFRRPVGGPVTASPVVVGDRAVFVTVPGKVVCLTPADGREAWSHGVARPGVEVRVLAGPAIAGDRLYVPAEVRAGGNGLGVVFALRLR